MSHVNKKLAITAAVAALTAAAIGAAMAQTADRPDDAQATQQVDVNGPPADHQIYFFRDQGNSPETDPAAHLLLIKHEAAPVPVAETTTTTTTTTVAQADTPAAPMADTTSTDNSAAMATDTTAAPADNSDMQPALAPKADRN